MRTRAFSSGDSRLEVAAAVGGVSWSDHQSQAFGGNASDQENTRTQNGGVSCSDHQSQAFGGNASDLENTRTRNSKASRPTAANNNTSMGSNALTEPMNATDLYTTEIVRALFGPTIGAVVGDYSCTFKRTSGRLYMATNALCYYSNLFNSESKYVFWIADMAELTKIKGSGVCIGMKTNSNGTTGNAQQQLQHSFRSFRDRDAVYQIICQLLSAFADSAIIGPPKTTRPPPGRAATFDASSLGLLFPESEAGADAATSYSSSRLLTKSLSSISETSSFNKWSKIPKASRKGRRKHRRIRSQSVDSSFDLRRRTDTGESGLTAEGGSASDVDSPEDEGQSNHDIGGDDTYVQAEGNEMVEDSAHSWSKLKEGRLKEIVLDDIHLPCSLLEFHKFFIADDCSHSFASFQKSVIGDFELGVEKWEKDNSVGTNSSKRTITFRHPLKHKLGPKDASMEKCQQLNLIPGHGIMLKSCTYGKGFPAADAFHVEDMWIIEPRNADESSSPGSSVSMSVFFQIHYSKSTMFKKMIDTNTKQEYTQMYDKYKDMVASTLGGETKPSGAVAAGIKDERSKPIVEDSTAETPLQRTIALFAIVILSILALAYISSLRSRVASLEQEMEEMRQNILLLQQSVTAANDIHSPPPKAPLLTLL